MQIRTSSEIIVHPALRYTQWLIDRALKEIDPNITRSQFERYSQTSCRLFRIPDNHSSALFTKRVYTEHTSNVYLRLQLLWEDDTYAIQTHRRDWAVMD